MGHRCGHPPVTIQSARWRGARPKPKSLSRREPSPSSSSKASAATPPLPPPLASAAAHPSSSPWAASAQREPTRQRPGDPDAIRLHCRRWLLSMSCRRAADRLLSCCRCPSPSPIVPSLPVTPSPLSSLSIVVACRAVVLVGVDVAWISIVRCRRRAPQQGRATQRSSRRPNPRCRPASSPAPTTPHRCMNADGCRGNLALTVGM